MHDSMDSVTLDAHIWRGLEILADGQVPSLVHAAHGLGLAAIFASSGVPGGGAGTDREGLRVASPNGLPKRIAAAAQKLSRELPQVAAALQLKGILGGANHVGLSRAEGTSRGMNSARSCGEGVEAFPW